MTIRLGVNVDHVATIREARKTNEPDPVHAAVIAQHAGADLITVHLREDRRHIQERDVHVIKKAIDIPLNLEMAPTQAMVAFALELQPDSVTLVPENRTEITTEGGLDLLHLRDTLIYSLRYLKDAGIKTSLFIEPNLNHIKEAKRLGTDAVEIHTGSYANARGRQEIDKKQQEIAEACRAAARLQLQVHAGHGLTLRNLQPIAKIAELEEVNIGHSIVSRAVFVGFERAIQEFRQLLDTSHWSLSRAQ